MKELRIAQLNRNQQQRIAEVARRQVRVIEKATTLPAGTTTGDILYWDEDENVWKKLAAPAGPAVLAFDATNKLHWALLKNDCEVPQRKADDTVDGDYVRYHP